MRSENDGGGKPFQPEGNGPFHPWGIEEPTSPDDVIGHAAIAKELLRSKSPLASIA